MDWFLDYDDNDIALPMSSDTAVDEHGNLLFRVNDYAAMDLETGELHVISGWSDKDKR